MGYALKIGFGLLVAVAMAQAPAMAKGHSRDRDHGSHGYERQRADRDVGRYELRRRAVDGNYRSYLHKDPNYRPATPRVVRRAVYHPAYHAHPGWARGAHYYREGYAPTYVVQDYRVYGLRAPPRDHYWRRSQVGDFLLVAAATGIITDLILKR